MITKSRPFAIVVLLVCVVFTTGCASLHYKKINSGTLKGKLLVQWIDYDKFIFTPSKNDPLVFIRYNQKEIKPGKMYTDGGSIPRALWVLKSYSPWGYAPAYIIHDWLFEMKHCGLQGNEEYDHKIAANVLAEVVKTLMEDSRYGGENKLVLYTLHKAVSSDIAKSLWYNGTCDIPRIQKIEEQFVRPIFEYEIEF